MKMNRTRLFLLLFFLSLVTTNIFSQANVNLSTALPNTIDGWAASTERTFNDSTLYSYIDGAAELYLSFGFTKVYNRIYSRAEQPDIIVDIFYMNSSYDAYGVFTHTVGKTEKEFGVQSQHTQGAIVFWKANYYVSIFANPETEESKTVMIKLAKGIGFSIQGESKLPDVLNCLPEKEMDKESVRYFKHYIWLNSYYNISRENILNISQNTHAALAKYGTGKQKNVLLVIQYPSEEEARTACEKFIDAFDKGLKNKSVLMHNKKWCGVELMDNYFVGVFNSENKAASKKMISLVREKINNKPNN
jgi:hypothetical protein